MRHVAVCIRMHRTLYVCKPLSAKLMALTTVDCTQERGGELVHNKKVAAKATFMLMAHIIGPPNPVAETHAQAPTPSRSRRPPPLYVSQSTFSILECCHR